MPDLAEVAQLIIKIINTETSLLDDGSIPRDGTQVLPVNLAMNKLASGNKGSPSEGSGRDNDRGANRWWVAAGKVVSDKGKCSSEHIYLRKASAPVVYYKHSFVRHHF